MTLRFRLLLGATVTAGALLTSLTPAAAAPVPAWTSSQPSSVVTESAEGVRAASPAVADLAAEAPDRAEVRHKPWQQKKPSWCAPASVQLSLRTFGVKVTQDVLAEQMETDSVGTTGANMRVVYDSYLNDAGYEMSWVDGRDPEALMDAVSYDVGVLGRAIPLGVVSTDASWIDASGEFGHVVSVRGYDRTEGTFTIWDPSAESYGGHHTVTVEELAEASQKNGLAFVTRL